LTSEFKPVHKSVGSRVIDDSINDYGVLKVKVDKSDNENMLGTGKRLVEQAQESRTRIQDITDKATALLFYTSNSIDSDIKFALRLLEGY